MSLNQMTITGKLKYGIDYNNKTHFDFEMRLPTVQDNLDAMDLAGDDASQIKVDAILFVLILTSLGDMPLDKVKHEYLLKNLIDDDFNVLQQSLADLRKKRQDASQN